MYLVETKGREDMDVARKARAAVAWCEAASKGGTTWKYVYVPESATGAMGTGSWSTLVGAAATALDALVHEEEIQQQAPLFMAALTGEAKPAVPALVDQAVLDALPPNARKAADEALLMFDFLRKQDNANLAPPFAGLLGAIDGASRTLILNRLQSAVPPLPDDQRVWFDPYRSGLGSMPAPHYEKLAKNLRKTLLFNAGLMPIGLLRECLDYALNDVADYPGVFKAVRAAFKVEGSRKFRDEVLAIYEFRNKYVAHQEMELTDPAFAAKALARWIGGLATILQAAATTPAK